MQEEEDIERRGRNPTATTDREERKTRDTTLGFLTDTTNIGEGKTQFLIH